MSTVTLEDVAGSSIDSEEEFLHKTYEGRRKFLLLHEKYYIPFVEFSISQYEKFIQFWAGDRTSIATISTVYASQKLDAHKSNIYVNFAHDDTILKARESTSKTIENENQFFTHKVPQALEEVAEQVIANRRSNKNMIARELDKLRSKTWFRKEDYDAVDSIILSYFKAKKLYDSRGRVL